MTPPEEVSLDDMALFARLVEGKSLSAASRATGLPKSTLSRRLARLEDALGTRLVFRNTRAFAVTEAGAEY